MRFPPYSGVQSHLAAALLFGAALGACSSPTKEALILLKVDVPADLPAISSVRFSVANRTDIPVRTVPGDPRPLLMFGYYLPGVNGAVQIVAEALDARTCIVGQGQLDVTGVVAGEKKGPLSLALSKLATAVCPPDGGVDARDSGMDGRDGGGDVVDDGGGPDIPPPKLGRGEVCVQDNDCALNHCVDGVCCESECTGTCESCAEAGLQKGTCVAVTGDPRGTKRPKCAGGGTACAGMCDGTNRTACTFPDERVRCGMPSCMNGLAAGAPACDRVGGCRQMTPVACNGNMCADATKCANGCDTAGGTPCPSTKFCNTAGACEDKIADGEACNNDAYCQSGSCIDGHCCSQVCGSCEACTGPGGTCVKVMSGDDADSCAGDRTCDATGACKARPGKTCKEDVDCSTGHCVDGHCCTKAMCGTCEACTGGGGACVSVSAADDDTCSGTKSCDVNGACKSKQGQECGFATDCLLGHCVDGVCCESDCSGQCEACAEADQQGTCVKVMGNPRNMRTKCAGAGTACGGMCDGTSRTMCVFPDAMMKCGASSCMSGTVTPEPTCDRMGGCRPGMATMCGKNQCADAMKCSDGCDAVSAPCAATDFCNSGGACQKKYSPGTSCNNDSECMTGHCIDGHCCQTDSCMTCQSCTAPDGTCVAVKNAEDPGSCATDRLCDSTGACKVTAGGACMMDSECSTGHCIDRRCCGSTSCPKCYACTGGGGACVPVMGMEDDLCMGTQSCDALGVCKAKEGETCAVNEDCLSTHCVDGVCCESACNGQCEACGEASQKGKCVAVSGAPRTIGFRPDCGGKGTGMTGFANACYGSCNGTNRAACVYPDSTVTCGSSSCSAGIATSKATCGSLGACTRGSDAPCGSGTCQPPAMAGGMSTGCAGSCDPVTAPCPLPTQYCDTVSTGGDGACHTKLGAGAMCSSGTQCGTGFCVDNRCCGSMNCPQCMSCTGAAGACAQVKSMDDDSCNGTQTCDASGMCRNRAGQTCNGNSECATGFCVDNHCCSNNSCSKCQACTGGGGSCVGITGDDPDTNPANACTGTQVCDSSFNCKTKQGQTCSNPNNTCITGICSDSRCCDMACSDPCHSCANTMGQCRTVTSAQDADTCATPMTCDSMASCIPITPNAPTNVMAAVSGARAVQVTWTVPGNNGVAIASYDVVDQAGTVRATVSGAATSMATAGSLTAGTAYTFRVRATNTAGATGPLSAASNSVTAADVPGAPTSVMATALSGGRAMLSWTAPSSNGGSAITGYTITASGVNTTATSSPTTISGLTSGAMYTFSVAATNAIGTGAAGTSNTITIGDVPGAPSNVMATAVVGGKVNLSWTAATGATSYTVTSTPPSTTVMTSGTSIAGLMTGLVIGTSYTFTVQATNGFGAGGSATSNSVTVGDVPGAPANFMVSKTGRRATLTWNPPTSPNGTITGYSVSSSPAGYSTTTDAATLTATFYKVPTGASYSFSVSATNSFGTGTAATVAAGMFTCTTNTHTVRPVQATNSITVQYGPLDVGDLSTSGSLDAAFNVATGIDTTGWVRFSLSNVPPWAVVTGVNFGVTPSFVSGTTSLVVWYSVNDAWSRDQNPKAANIARSTIVSAAAFAAGTINLLQNINLSIGAHDFSLDVEELSSYLTLGISNTAMGEAVYNGADAGSRAPFLDISTCE